MKKIGQVSVEFILVVGFIMLIFMVVFIVVWEKQKEALEHKTFLDAQRICHSVVANINTISEQGDGYYRFFSVPDKLYGEQNYSLTIYKYGVEITWGTEGYAWVESPITAAAQGRVHKGEENKVMNCGGVICIGDVNITCEECLNNTAPNVTISYPAPGTYDCGTITFINGTASDINGNDTIGVVEVKIDWDPWKSASGINNWSYPWAPTEDGTYSIKVRATDEYGGMGEYEISVNISKCTNLKPVNGTFTPSTASTGESIPISIDVNNTGVGSAASVVVNFSCPLCPVCIPGPVCTLGWSNSNTISELGSGQTKTATVMWPVPLNAINYSITVTADPADAIDESNETDNDYTHIVQVVTDPPTSNITDPEDGDALNCGQIIIKGNASDDGWITKVEVSTNGTYGPWYEAEGNETWNYTWTPPEDGNYTICSNAKDNNNYSQMFQHCINVTVSGCAELPNLVPVEDTLIPEYAGVNSTMDLCVNVTNNGGGNVTETFVVRFTSMNESGSCDGKRCYGKSVDGLNVGEVKRVCVFNVQAPNATKNYTISIEVDYFNNITERNETDNNDTGVIEVIEIFCNIELIPGSVWQDHPQFVRFKIINNGTYPQTIDNMNVTWDLVGAVMQEVNIPQGDEVWGGTAGSGQAVDIADVTIDAGTENTVKLGFDRNMKDANIAVIFILDDGAVCDPILLYAPGSNETCGNCMDEDNDTLPDWADPDCNQFFRDEGCGEVHYCDPPDGDNCAGDCGSCSDNLGSMPELDDNDTKTCSNYYGYSTAEWHFYKIIPGADGKLIVNFSGNAPLGGSETDLSIYNTLCNRLNHTYGSSESNIVISYDVTALNTYIIALDVDACIADNDCAIGNCTCGYTHPKYIACNCSKVGSYTLTTTLTP
ncbi:MAG: hypothetical protein A7316_00910 [Candidatus Altiarchaeales archaeon WOR_SM1_86-2]|nr:MAG: hypothetical protein A7316_00910 [Candidatus Altiarchaeales archaeon WOR_SM1_86-2]